MALDPKLVAILQHWYWDPIPDYIRLDPGQIEKWGQMEKEFANRQAAIQIEKIEAFQKLAGKKIG